MSSQGKQNNEYVRVAYYYYKVGLTQEEIAKKMLMSRQRVNRILKKCTELGIVKITIQGYQETHIELEAELEKRYNLKEVIITDIEGNLYDELGMAANHFLMNILQDGDIVGFSRGRAMSAMIDTMENVEKKNITVTQLVGGCNESDTNISSDDIVRRCAEKWNTKPCFLYAPIIVSNRKLKESMIQDSFFAEAYKVIQSCTIAVVGIGDIMNKPLFLQKSTVMEDEYTALLEKHAIGEICTHYFDKNGNAVKSSIDDRVIAVNLPSYKKIPVRIGVAGGKEKHEVVLGAIRGGYINVLVTDLDTALALSNAPDFKQ